MGRYSPSICQREAVPHYHNSAKVVWGGWTLFLGFIHTASPLSIFLEGDISRLYQPCFMKTKRQNSHENSCLQVRPKHMWMFGCLKCDSSVISADASSVRMLWSVKSEQRLRHLQHDAHGLMVWSLHEVGYKVCQSVDWCWIIHIAVGRGSNFPRLIVLCYYTTPPPADILTPMSLPQQPTQIGKSDDMQTRSMTAWMEEVPHHMHGEQDPTDPNGHREDS